MLRRVVALTPNPAIDRTLTLDQRLRPGKLHRVRRVREAAGGKGANLARAVVALGGKAVVAGPIGGNNGRTFRALLASEGLDSTMTEVRGETRQCTIVLDGSGHPTEIYEAGPEVTEEAWRSLLRSIPQGRVVVSGSLPPGTAPERFGALLEGLAPPLAVDGHGPFLVAALHAGAELIAPNRSELAELARALDLDASPGQASAENTPGTSRTEAGAHDPVGPDPDRPEAGDLERVLAATAAVRHRFGARIVVTLGATGAVLASERTYLVRAPAVTAVNPVGSGDCLLGAFLWAEEAGLPEREALTLGVAAGAENARRGGGGTLEGATIRALASTLTIEELD